MTTEYIAGFFDGEGTVSTSGNKIRISIPQTNKEVLEEIKNFLGFGNILTEKLRKAHWKQSWVFYTTNSRDSVSFLDKVLPFLIVKKKKSEEAKVLYKSYLDSKEVKKEKYNDAITMVKQGKSYREIEKEIGVGRQTIVRLMK